MRPFLGFASASPAAGFGAGAAAGAGADLGGRARGLAEEKMLERRRALEAAAAEAMANGGATRRRRGWGFVETTAREAENGERVLLCSLFGPCGIFIAQPISAMTEYFEPSSSTQLDLPVHYWQLRTFFFNFIFFKIIFYRNIFLIS